MIETITNQDLMDPELKGVMESGKRLPRYEIHAIPEQEYQDLVNMKRVLVSTKDKLDASRADYVELADQMDRQTHAAKMGRVKSAVGSGIVAAALILGVAADVVNPIFGCAVAGVCCLLEAWCWRGRKDV